MRKPLMMGVALLLALSGPVGAQLSDDFDSYADQAAFNAVWSGSSPMSLTNNNWVSAPNSIYQGTSAQQSYRKISTGIPLQQLYFGFDFYDEQGTASLARSYGMVYSRAGDQWTGALQQIIAVGKYNTIATTKYNARIAFGSLNWFVLDQGPDRSVGWHRAEVIGGVDPNDPTKAKVDIFIDGILGKTVTGLTNVSFNWVVMGSGLSSSHGMYFDNVVARPVPEPASIALAGVGLAGIVGLRRRMTA